MDRINVFIGVLVTALALGPAGTASAQEEETSEFVDWDDALNYAELMDTFVNDDGVVMATYYDEAQNVLWSQPAALEMEEAADALFAGPEKAATLLITQWIVPTSLWLCDNNESGDTNCTTGVNYRWTSSEISLFEVNGTYAEYYADKQPNTCMMSSIERVRATGHSSSSDYCDAYFHGQYHVSAGGWTETEQEDCGYGKFYWYELDDSTNINARTYMCSNPYEVARFKFRVSSTTYYSVIWLAGCIL